MSRIVLGLDFGTSNTSVSYADLDDAKRTVKTVILENADDEHTSYKTMPSAMFYIPDLHKLLVGRKAIQAYINREYESGRLLRNLKSILDNVDATTNVSDTRQISYFQFIYNFLKRVKERVIAATGTDNIVGIVVGRPVHFFDNDDDRDKKAEQNLHRIIEALGFTNIVFLEEPIAASFSLEAKIPTDTTALVADIGGGTSDFAAIALGPSHKKQTNRKTDVFATTGIKVGGTDFDKSFSLHSFMPELGFGTEVRLANGSTIMFPRKYFDKLSNAFSINELYDCSVINEIEEWYLTSLARPRISDLLNIIKTENGHILITEVETCKKGLSYKLQYTFQRKEAFNLSDDLFMTKRHLEQAISKFNILTESTLDKTHANELLDNIKSELKYLKDQFVESDINYDTLFGPEENHSIQQCKRQINNIIYNSLKVWINKISSMTLNDIQKEFVKHKTYINTININKIDTNLNYFRELKQFKIIFEPDYNKGYETLDNLFAVPLPENKIKNILEPVNNYIIQHIKHKKETNIQTEVDKCIKSFINDIKIQTFKTCLDCTKKSDTLLQTITELIHFVELSMFDLPDINVLEKHAIDAGAIYKDAEISKTEFEASIDEYMSRLQDAVNKCIKESGKRKSDFKYLIMTGGSSRIPMVRQSIQGCFNEDIKVICEDLSKQKDLSHDVVENIDTPDDISVGLCMYALNIFK